MDVQPVTTREATREKFEDAASNDFKDNDEGIDGINKDGSCYGCH